MLQKAKSATEIIEVVRDEYGFATDRDLANFLGIAESSLSSWKRRDSPNLTLLIEKFPDLSLDWLLRDVGNSRIMAVSTSQTAHSLRIPMFLSPVSAGIPTPAGDEPGDWLDIPGDVVPHDEFFAVRVAGNSMQDAGIRYGDVLLVDRRKQPQRGDIVVAVLEGETCVKRFEVFRRKGQQQMFLYPANEEYSPIEITGRDGLIQGVVNRLLRELY